jgi:hypothetical protein
VYPRYRWLVGTSLAAFLGGFVAMWIWHARFREILERASAPDARQRALPV